MSRKAKQKRKLSYEKNKRSSKHIHFRWGTLRGRAMEPSSRKTAVLYEGIIDTLSGHHVKPCRLRHPTFQRIFGRVEEARGAGPSLGLPLSAISGSNWSPESAEVRPLFKAPRCGRFPVSAQNWIAVKQSNLNKKGK
jgi:hypothetical protein